MAAVAKQNSGVAKFRSLRNKYVPGGRPLKDCYEAVGHGAVYGFMLELARQRDMNITEDAIKKLHRLFTRKLTLNNLISAIPSMFTFLARHIYCHCRRTSAFDETFNRSDTFLTIRSAPYWVGSHGAQASGWHSPIRWRKRQNRPPPDEPCLWRPFWPSLCPDELAIAGSR